MRVLRGLQNNRREAIETTAPVQPEPQVFGVEIDPQSAALYDQFAEGRSREEIYDLIVDPEVIDPTIRQRAVAAFTAPAGIKLPYPHGDLSIGSLNGMTEEIKGRRTSSLRERMDGRLEVAEELAQGMLYWLDTTGGRVEGHYTDSRHDYHVAIRNLLPIVDADTADKLFTHYPLNDIDAYYGMEDCSGYNPLKNLLRDRQTPRVYKEIGLSKWFAVAQLEERGDMQPREEHERATRHMAEFVQSSPYCAYVDKEVHTSIVGFLENQTPDGAPYIDGYNTRQVAEHITDEELRANFALRHVLADTESNHGKFRVSDEHDIAMLDWLREEASKRGIQGFDEHANALVRNYETERERRVANKLAEKALREQLRG